VKQWHAHDGWEINPVTRPFELSLARLRNVQVAVTASGVPDEEGSAAIVVKFSDGTALKFFYWRLVQDGRARLSSFDHQKKYGLPAPIDAKERISAVLSGKICLNVQFHGETGDLTLLFAEATKLQVFNFTKFEIWDILFPDGTREFSSYALE
jgi:hypothetical protein